MAASMKRLQSGGYMKLHTGSLHIEGLARVQQGAHGALTVV